MVILWVDESLIAGTQAFLNEENLECKSFMSKARKLLNEIPFLFIGLKITYRRSGEKSIRQQNEENGHHSADDRKRV